MTPLTKQLEDKKKELMKEDKSILVNFLISLGKENTNLNKKLEQAIAEMQKRDKEEIEWIEGKIKLFKEIHSLSGIHIELGFLDRIEQLQSQQTSKEIVSSSELANADISNLLQKQRQEIIDKIDLYLMVTKGNYECQKALEELKQQLNQPKTEKENSK